MGWNGTVGVPVTFDLYMCLLITLKLLSLSDQSNTIMPLCMMQYYFTGDIHDLPNVPHGNSKGLTPYKCTKASTMKRLKEVCRTHLPSQACSIVESENGGVMDAESSGSLPRS